MELKNRCILRTLAVTCCIAPFLSVSGLPLVSNKVEEYLMRFGYLEPSIRDIEGSALAQHSISEALRQFQKMAGLTETGSMNFETGRMMEMPRCGVPEVFQKRVKRHGTLKGKWPKNDLKYFLKNYSPDLPPDVIEKEVRRALEVWSEVSGLNFDRSADLYSADIEIAFERLAHGDRNDFDGQGGIVAHAFYPQNGDLHFDDDELWTSNNSRGINIFQVAVHEIGHSLGFDHSSNRDSVMAPFYRGYNPNFRLHSEDIEAVQAHYGSRYGRTGAPPTTKRWRNGWMTTPTTKDGGYWPTDATTWEWRDRTSKATTEITTKPEDMTTEMATIPGPTGPIPGPPVNPPAPPHRRGRKPKKPKNQKKKSKKKSRDSSEEKHKRKSTPKKSKSGKKSKTKSKSKPPPKKGSIRYPKRRN